MAGAIAVAGEGLGEVMGAELALAEGMSESRRGEFLSGRACARAALARCGARAVSVLRDVRGLPQWPRGFVGSITHCKGLCAAVAAPVETAAMVGLDIERTDRLSPAAIRRVVHPAEADWVRGERWRASLLFSLKEAFFKAQFPSLEISANFRDLAVEIDLEGGRASCGEAGSHLEAVATDFAARGEFRFVTAGPHVASLCWLAA
ncbi:MAG: 4'-phosphopantetheinyl transferase family protein [Verrucomicrobiota bacterium]